MALRAMAQWRRAGRRRFVPALALERAPVPATTRSAGVTFESFGSIAVELRWRSVAGELGRYVVLSRRLAAHLLGAPDPAEVLR